MSWRGKISTLLIPRYYYTNKFKWNTIYNFDFKLDLERIRKDNVVYKIYLIQIICIYNVVNLFKILITFLLFIMRLYYSYVKV